MSKTAPVSCLKSISTYILDNLKVISYRSLDMVKSQQGFDGYSNLHIMACTLNWICTILLQMYMRMNPLS